MSIVDAPVDELSSDAKREYKVHEQFLCLRRRIWGRGRWKIMYRNRVYAIRVESGHGYREWVSTRRGDGGSR